MQSAPIYPPPGPPNLEPNSGFNVVIAYEDFETGKLARKAYDFLVENLAPECQLTNQMWKFDVLAIPKLREMAAKDAAAAHIIIISSRGDEFPDYVKAWLEAWLGTGKPLALVALFDRTREEAAHNRGLRTYLAEVAKRGKMDFFAQPDDWPSPPPTDQNVLSRRGSRLSGKTLSTLAGACQRDIPIPHWRISD